MSPFVDEIYDYVPKEAQQILMKMVCEAAPICAADAICHPRDRVGNFDWGDVITLHYTRHMLISLLDILRITILIL